MATDQQVPERLYVLAFDHRATLRTMFADVLSAVDGDAQLARLKRVVLDALQRAVQAAPDGWLAPPTSGLLIDEELGAPEAKDAAAAGLTLAMPIERSGAPRFTLEYGDRFAEHVARFPSAWVKALVSLNPSSTNGGYATQIRELARVSEWLRAQGRRFMLEVLVPATPEQLAQVGGDSFRYDCEMRAELVCRTIADLYAAGV